MIISYYSLQSLKKQTNKQKKPTKTKQQNVQPTLNGVSVHLKSIAKFLLTSVEQNIYKIAR